MYVSHETLGQTEARLLQVIRRAEFKAYAQPYCFIESPIAEFSVDSSALALVRDELVWSQLVPARSDGTENFGLCSFHFEEGLDNSGFVGWLASKIKADLGAGLFVICGQNSQRGGIFDYWGCPVALTEEVFKYIDDLRTVN